MNDPRVMHERTPRSPIAVKLSPPTYGLAPEQTRAAQQQLLAVVADITGGKRPAGLD